MKGDFGLRFQNKTTYRGLIFRMFWNSGPVKGSGLHPRNEASKMKSHFNIVDLNFILTDINRQNTQNILNVNSRRTLKRGSASTFMKTKL